jgi:hypothetical protein
MNIKRANLKVLLLTGVLVLPFLDLMETSISAVPVSEPPFVLTIQDNQLSAKIERVSIIKVLEGLARLTKIEISLDRSIENEQVTVEFENLPLVDGIRRILQDKNYAMTYAQISTPRGHTALPIIVGIKVVPKSAVPSMDKESADSMIPLSNLETREGPFESIEPRTGEPLPGPYSSTASGLRDQDPKVREAALEALGQSGQPVPVESLAEMALKDTSPQLRMDAMDLLAEKGGEAALDTLRQAIRDPDPGVSGLAKGLLEERKILAEVLLEKLKEDYH